MEKLSVYRNEDKYLINKIECMEIEDKLSKLLKQDKHNNETYTVRTLYFDSINNTDFFEKLAGSEIRKKIRIRSYSSEDKRCKLEAKIKNGNLQHKISIWIDREDACELIKANYSVLFKYFKCSEEVKFIYKTMVIGCYRPVTMIEYDRTAFVYPELNIRLTLDKNVRASETNFNLFDKNVIFTSILNNEVILEVKYNKKLIDFISIIINKYKPYKTSVSKYCLGRRNFYSYLF